MAAVSFESTGEASGEEAESWRFGEGSAAASGADCCWPWDGFRVRGAMGSVVGSGGGASVVWWSSMVLPPNERLECGVVGTSRGAFNSLWLEKIDGQIR